MKLIIQIPCYNEAETLPQTIRDLPVSIPGIDVIEYLVIDDGSRDGTPCIAEQLGVHHIVRNPCNLGLARSFMRGIDYALGAGADIIVNTDGDNQYCGADIAKLVQPILEHRAEVVIGDRQTSNIQHFSLSKKLLQTVGSTIVRYFSGVKVPDAVSGFRAISRNAALRINIVSTFSYTIEMLIQVGVKGLAVASVPIRTNEKTRDSRLFKSVIQFIERSGTTTLRMYAMYQPLRAFSLIGAIIAFIGMIPMVRFLYYYFFITGEGKIQSLIIGCALLTTGAITFVLGLTGDLLGRNRQLIEMSLEKIRRIEHELSRTRQPELLSPEKIPVSDELDQRGNDQDDEQRRDVAHPR